MMLTQSLRKRISIRTESEKPVENKVQPEKHDHKQVIGEELVDANNRVVLRIRLRRILYVVVRGHVEFEVRDRAD